MGVLKTIEECFKKIDPTLVKDGIFYVELDEENYKILETDVSINYSVNEIKFAEEKVRDIGKATVLTLDGRKVVVVLNKEVKHRLDDMYIAFKTQLV